MGLIINLILGIWLGRRLWNLYDERKRRLKRKDGYFMEIDKMRRACDLMRKTGSDDSQYILVRLRDLEELLNAWETLHPEEKENEGSAELS